MELLRLFSVPMFKFKFDEHEKFKPQFMKILTDPEVYKETSVPGAALRYTTPNLHKMEEFKPFTDFFQSNLETVMDAMGYLPKVQITSMWGTEHQHMGAHHRHTHLNSFLGMVYYTNGWVRSSGTVFYSPYSFNQIAPAKSGKPEIIHGAFQTEFEEGNMYIFPAWLSHATFANNLSDTKTIRHVIAGSAMPLGPTNHDEWDRFDYQSVEDRQMISKRSERFK